MYFLKVCSDDDVCGNFFSDSVHVAMPSQTQLEDVIDAVLRHVLINERIGKTDLCFYVTTDAYVIKFGAVL